MSKALRGLSSTVAQGRVASPQTVRTPGRTDEVKNNAGGFVFKVSDVDRLVRFLILGTDKGTFYVSERNLTRANAGFVSEMIRTNEALVVDTTVRVSDEGRAKSNSQALFVLALVMTEGKDKARAREAVGRVVRTSYHLFEFAQYIDDLGGWGRAKRKAVASWYEDKDADALAYQAVKYRQRNGWTHRDAMRLSHPQGVDARVGNFMLRGEVAVDAPAILGGFQAVQAAISAKEVVSVLSTNKNLPWEALPTQFLTDADVWKTLFYNGALGQTALLRNVTRFAKIGLFNDLKFAGDVSARLADAEAIRKGRMHPISYLNAKGIYENGPIVSTSGWNASRRKEWTVNAKVAEGLEAGFYASFGNIEPANKRTSLSIDTSGSMTWHGPAGLVGLDCREAAAAMAMVTLRSEPYVEIRGFGTRSQDTKISASDSLGTVERKIDALPAGGTDCSRPMLDALERGVGIDTFVVYTDNETWAGRMKPVQALQKYRNETGIDARLVVVGMVASEFTIADPADAGMLDVVGFDAGAPRVLAEFSAGRL